MNVIKIGDFEYFEVPAIRIYQNGIKYYLFSINVKQASSICAFMPADYNEIEDVYIEAQLGDEKIQPSDLIKDHKDENFNRHLDKEKLKNIFKYANENDKAVFPNSVILAGHDKKGKLLSESEIDPNALSDDEIEDMNQKNGVYFAESKNLLYIPKIKHSILIVDGQHRIAGLSLLSEEKQVLIYLPITLVVGETNATLSSMFYTINSTQKPVNKSVLEYMTNLFLENLSEGKMFQEYIRVLNDNKMSPLYKEVKIFGTGAGLIAFSPLHEAFMNMTIPVKKSSKKIPIFRALYVNEDNQYKILDLIVFFFRALKNQLNDPSTTDWRRDVVFTKTIGLVALLQLFPRVILKVLEDKYDINRSDSLLKIVENDFDQQIENIKKVDTKKYEKAGSMGLSKQLRDELMTAMGLDHYDDKYAKKLNWLNEFYI